MFLKTENWFCEVCCCCRTLRTSHEVADSGSFGEPENEVFCFCELMCWRLFQRLSAFAANENAVLSSFFFAFLLFLNAPPD